MALLPHPVSYLIPIVRAVQLVRWSGSAELSRAARLDGGGWYVLGQPGVAHTVYGKGSLEMRYNHERRSAFWWVHGATSDRCGLLSPFDASRVMRFVSGRHNFSAAQRIRWNTRYRAR